MIALESIDKVYTLGKEVSVAALREANLQIPGGEFVVVTGRSGSGKTTLLNLIAGLTRPTSGRVLFDGQDLWRLSDRQRSAIRNQKIGFVFQFPSLLPSLTVLENVLLPAIFHDSAGEGVLDRGRGLLDSVGLSEKMLAYPRQLSAGQQQRVVIARALLNEPDLLLADEPTSNLDEQTEQEIMELFREIHARTRVTIVLVTHTAQLVRYGNRSLQMADGRITEPGAGAPSGS